MLTTSCFASGSGETWYSPTFMQWLEAFVVHVRHQRGFKRLESGAMEMQPVLLVLDQHSTHITIPSLEFAALHGIVVFALLPHTSHITQPLDVACYGPWQRALGQAVSKQRQINPNFALSKTNFPELMAPAWASALSATNAIAGFAATGIHPFDPERVLKRFRGGATVRDGLVKSASPSSSSPSSSSSFSSPGSPPAPGSPEEVAYLRREVERLRAENILRIPETPTAPAASARARVSAGQGRAFTSEELLERLRDAETKKEALRLDKLARKTEREQKAAAKREEAEAAKAARLQKKAQRALQAVTAPAPPAKTARVSPAGKATKTARK